MIVRHDENDIWSTVRHDEAMSATLFIVRSRLSMRIAAVILSHSKVVEAVCEAMDFATTETCDAREDTMLLEH